MELDYIYRRTARGNLAVSDAAYPMSAGFKKLLAAFDGTKPIIALKPLFPHLDDEDLKDWTAELIRQQCIESTLMPRAAQSAPAKLAAFDAPELAGGPITQQSASLTGWAVSTQTFQAVDADTLGRTTRMATIEAKSAALVLERDGVFIDAAVSGEFRQARRSFQILVVEDEPSQALVLRRLMEREGHKVTLAMNRAEIMAALNQMPLPELILLDVELPDTNGFHVLEKVRQHAILKRIPVVMVTGRAAQSDVAKGVMLGANGYVTKPFRPPVLIGAVNRALGI